MDREISQTLSWIPITEETEFENHEWYLLAHKDFGTPVKARFHDDIPHFEILVQNWTNDENSVCYEWDWKEKIPYYMEMPKLPWEIKNESKTEIKTTEVQK